METVIQDVRYAARKLLHSPGFTVVVVATLALAIGATTAIFSVVYGVLLKPLPFGDPAKLVVVSSADRAQDKLNAMSTLDFIDYRDQSRSFVGMAALDQTTLNVTGNSMEPTRVRAAQVGAKFFDLMGAPIQLGRGFVAGEDQRDAPRVVVLSDAMWRGHYGADPRILGQTIRLDGDMYTVVGVAHASFNFPRADLYVPFVFAPWQTDPANRGSHSHYAIGRVKDGVTVDAASRELATVAKRLEEQYPRSNTGFSAKATPLHEYIVGNAEKPLAAMFGAVLLVLLIACANVANLLLVRASGRESEMAVRTALGAGRGRIVRQLITESAMLSVAGAVIGVALASWVVAAVVAFAPAGVPRIAEVAIDAKVLGFTALVAVLTGLLFGVVPALYAARPDIAQMLRESVRGSSKGGAQRTRSALVIAEMTLAVVLLVGAGLLIRSFVRLVNVDPGFNPQNVVAFNLSLPTAKYAYERHVRDFVARLEEQAKQIPGTRAVGVTFGRPLENSGMMITTFEVEGWPRSEPGKRRLSRVHVTSPGYFAALGIPLVRGRLFTEQDNRSGAPPVVVVTQEFVRRHFANEEPIGKKLSYGITHDTAATGQGEAQVTGEIIGVVGDVKQQDLASEAYPTSYAPFNTYAMGFFSVVIRTDSDLRTVQNRIKTIVRGLDRDLPIFGLTTMEESVSDSVAQPRFYMLLLGSFAGIALLLAALGIYGVISYGVSQRTRELGIRVALGATRQRIVQQVVRQGAVLAIAGIIVGVVASLSAVKALSSLTFGVERFDPVTLVLAPLTLLAAALLGSYLPARRAANVDPVIAMRND